jgi:outer membrane protein assembly factor BamD
MHVTRLLRARVCGPALVAVLLVLPAGCAAKKGLIPPTTAGEPDRFLFERGTQLLNQRHWLKSREYFRQLVDNYPQSRYRPDAKLGLGDTYLGEDSTESLVLGINEFKEFLTFYPTNDRADYAQLKLALCHYAQMLAPLRDQSQTKEAIKEFETFVERYPNSHRMAEGAKKLRECKDRLSDADYQVGYFYYRSRWYPGAISRFRAIMKRDPEYTTRDALYYYLADSYVKAHLGAEALPLLDRLVKEFDKSQYLERAKRLMVEAQAVGPFVPPGRTVKPAKKGTGQGQDDTGR